MDARKTRPRNRTTPKRTGFNFVKMEILNSLPEDFIAKKILLIDDDRDFVEINRITLKNRGYDVVTADNGKDGLLK